MDDGEQFNQEPYSSSDQVVKPEFERAREISDQYEKKNENNVSDKINDSRINQFRTNVSNNDKYKNNYVDNTTLDHRKNDHIPHKDNEKITYNESNINKFNINDNEKNDEKMECINKKKIDKDCDKFNQNNNITENENKFSDKDDNTANFNNISTTGPQGQFNIHEQSKSIEKTSDYLSPEHSQLIMEALTKVNDISDAINQKDYEYQQAQKQMEIYVSEFEIQLNELSQNIGQAVTRCQNYYEERNIADEMFKVANRMARDLKFYSESQDEMRSQLSQLEASLNEKRAYMDPDDPSYHSLLFQINGIVSEINDLNNNQESIDRTYQHYMAALKKTQQQLCQKEILMPTSIHKAKPYYELKKTMMEGLVEHQKRLERISKEKAELRYQYKISLSDIDKLGMRLEDENKTSRSALS